MNRTTLTDAGLQHLAGLTGLEELDLQGSSIGDRGVAALKDLREIRAKLVSGRQGGRSRTPASTYC